MKKTKNQLSTHQLSTFNKIMKKTLYFALSLLAITFISYCNPRTGEQIPPAANKYKNGLLILNEGNFSQANGNLSFFQFATGNLLADIVNTENNGVSLNATIQNAAEASGKTCVVTNSPDQLVIFSSESMKVEGTISAGLQNPFDVAIANGKAYVSTWGDNYFPTYANATIKIINLTTRQIVNTISVGKEINSVIAIGNKVYVASTGENKVLVINTTTDQTETSINVANEPDAFTVDSNGKLWVLCSSGNLVRINPNSNTVETTISGVSASAFGYNEKITTSGSTLYWIGETTTGFANKGIFSMSITGATAPTVPLVVGDKFYGIGYGNGQLIGGIAPNFSSNGSVVFYNPNGTVARTIISGGVSPNGFLVR